MVARRFLIACVMFALMHDAPAQEGPADRYGPLPGTQETGAVDVVPDSRPLLPPDTPVNRGPLGGFVDDEEESPGAALGETTPPAAASGPADRSPGSTASEDGPGSFRLPARTVRPLLRERPRDARSSVATETSQSLTARQWIAELHAEPAEGALVGQPITLGEALRGIRGEARQQEIIDAYWRLSRSVASYHVAVHVLAAVGSDPIVGRPAPGSAAGRSAVRLRLEAARLKLAAVETQADLAALIEFSPTTLPLPASLPHVGTYRTRYDEIFAKNANRPALRLHSLLPAQADLLRAHAEMLNVLASSNDGEVADSFRDQCREFLDAVYAYNRNIANYVLLATNDGDGADLVPMLIKVEQTKTNSSDTTSNVVLTELAEEPDSSGVEHSVLIRPAEETKMVPVEGNGAGPTAGDRQHQSQPEGNQSSRPGGWKQR